MKVMVDGLQYILGRVFQNCTRLVCKVNIYHRVCSRTTSAGSAQKWERNHEAKVRFLSTVKKQDVRKWWPVARGSPTRATEGVFISLRGLQKVQRWRRVPCGPCFDLLEAGHLQTEPGSVWLPNSREKYSYSTCSSANAEDEIDG